MEGKNFAGIENLSYNLGYRNLSAAPGGGREVGYVFGSEYLYKVSKETSIIPLIEYVDINNFTGAKGRNARYSTLALIGNYSSWTASTSIVSRNIARSGDLVGVSDRLVQFSIGYKFTDNFTIDVSRGNAKESGKNAAIFGTTFSYVYKF